MLRFHIALLIASALAIGQVPVVEPPEQAEKLLRYAEKLGEDAKRAVASGQRKALADARTMPSGVEPGGNLDATAEQLINQRTTSANGIFVAPSKVYDDSLLQQMLSSAQNRLFSLQGFDQSGLARALGNVTGANQQISSFGISGGVSATQTAASAPAPTTALPTTQAPSASDILNEQLQLTYEIANLRLLLEGSLSDQIMVGRTETFAKPRVTLGFPIVISPERSYRNAVAIVEVLVETDKDNDASLNGEAPSITALLPREKTYNIAAISDKSASLGGGIATATAGASATFLWGHKQYFIVKDQDTLAVQFEPSKPEQGVLGAKGVDIGRLRAFAWQFRPVLGRPFVQAGARQVFVQLSFPGRGSAATKSFGNITVRTYWRQIDRKTGVLKDVVPGSLRESAASAIPNYDMHQRYGAVAAFNQNSLEDLGTGQMLVKLEGRLLPGTYLRIGSNVIQPGAGGIPSDQKTTRFVANTPDLATLKTFVISRDGTEYQLTIPSSPNINNFRVDLSGVKVSTLDDSTSLLQIPITNFIDGQDIPPVFVIGGKVFGYSDMPIDRACNSAAGTCVLSAALPTSLLVSSPLVSVKALMLDESGAIQSELKANRTFSIFPQSAVPEKLVFLSRGSTAATYLVYGRDLNQIRVLWPAANADPNCPPNQLCMQPVSQQVDDPSLKLIRLPLEVAKDASPLIVQRRSDHPFLLTVPAAPGETPGPTEKKAKQEPKFLERVVVGSDEASIVGDNLDPITEVKFGGKPLTILKRNSGLIKLAGLASTGASAVAKTQDVTLFTLGGSSKIKLEVVSGKVEVIQK